MGFCGTPFGGPASGFAPSGKAVRPTTPLGVVGATTPPAPPAPSCQQADLLADCFASCNGMIDNLNPGPVCGWTFSPYFGNKGGQVTFTPGSMSLDVLGGISDTPGASKSLNSIIFDIINLAFQTELTEFPGSVGNAGALYQVFVFDQNANNFVQLLLRADGFLQVILGPVNNANGYHGAWSPNGGTHKLDVAADGAGVPTLFIDDVAIPLIFDGNGFSILGGAPSNSMAFYAQWGSATASAIVSNAFVTTGNPPHTTQYCCP